MNAILEVKNLTKQYEGFQLDGINFELPKGAIMGLIGENGAGKSTIINSILNLIQLDSGEVTFSGEQLNENANHIKEDIGVVFDSLNFYETLTPIKIEKILKSAYKNWDTKVFHQYIEQFELPLKKEIKTLSKGMHMKLSIALALAHHPKLLILDEATSGLDPIIRDEILDIFLDFVQDENHSILVSSHITSDLEKIADYITFIHDGKLLFSKSKDDLIYGYGIIKCNDEQYATIDKKDKLAYRKVDYGWQVLVEDKEKIEAKYRGFIVDNASIDDIMLLYVKGEQ